MDVNHRIVAGPIARRGGAALRRVVRCAPWLVLSSALAACTPPSTVKPTPDPVPPAPAPTPAPPNEENEGWKAITG